LTLARRRSPPSCCRRAALLLSRSPQGAALHPDTRAPHRTPPSGGYQYPSEVLKAPVRASCVSWPAGIRPFPAEHPGMDEETPAAPATLAPLSLAAAAKASGVSTVTLRKHLKAGRLAATKTETGAHGVTWAIDPATLAAFVGARYGTPIDLAGLPPVAPASAPRKQADTESMADLRRRLEDTLQELGRYKALTEASAAADTRVESILAARIAELTIERDAALSRRWWQRRR